MAPAGHVARAGGRGGGGGTRTCHPALGPRPSALGPRPSALGPRARRRRRPSPTQGQTETSIDPMLRQVKVRHPRLRNRNRNGKVSRPSPLSNTATLFRGILLPKHLEIGRATFFGSLQSGKVRTPSFFSLFFSFFFWTTTESVAQTDRDRKKASTLRAPRYLTDY